jgi:hypothetical protein
MKEKVDTELSTSDNKKEAVSKDNLLHVIPFLPGMTIG